MPFVLGTFSLQAQSMWVPVHKESDQIIQKIESITAHDDNRLKCLLYIDRLQQIAQKKNNKTLLSRSYYWRAWCLLRHDMDSASVYINKSVALLDTVCYQYDYARLLLLREYIYSETGNYLEAYKICVRLAAFFESVGDKQYLAYTKCNMGLILIQLEETGEAEKLQKQSIVLFKELGLEEKALKTQLNLCRCFFLNGEADKAIRLARKLLDSPYAKVDKYFTICTLRALNCYVSDINEQKEIIDLAYKHALSYNNSYLTNSILVNKGLVELKLSNLDNVMYCAREIKQYALKYNKIGMLRYAYDLHASAFAEYCQWDSAYYYSHLYQLLTEEVKGVKVSSEIKRIQSKRDVEKYQMELQQSGKQIGQQRNTIIIVVIALIIVLTLSCIIIYLVNKRTKAEKLLKKMEVGLLDKRLKNEVDEKKQFKEEVDLKNRELFSNTLLLSRKNQILNNLIAEIKKMEENKRMEKQDAVNLKKKIEENIRSDDDWGFFKLHFEKVHPDFFSILKQRFPALTENELRLCAYLKINLTTKQIAKMLYIMPRTVTVEKYRIKQKMELVDESPEGFLHNF